MVTISIKCTVRIPFALTCTPEFILIMIIVNFGEILESPVMIDPRYMLVLLGVVMVIVLLQKFGKCVSNSYIGLSVSMTVMLGTQFCSVSQMDLEMIAKYLFLLGMSPRHAPNRSVVRP